MTLQAAHPVCCHLAEIASQFLALKRRVREKTVLSTVLSVALSAIEGLRSMKLQVIPKALLPREGLRTFDAVERTLLLVAGPHVVFQLTLDRGGIFAQIALMMLWSWGISVNMLSMRGQAPLVGKTSLAFVTFEFCVLDVR